MSQVGLVAEIRLRKRLRGLRIVCQRSLLDRLSCEDEHDIIPADEEDEHNAWNLFLDAVALDEPDMLVESSLAHEELASTEQIRHLSMNLFCQEMHALRG